MSMVLFQTCGKNKNMLTNIKKTMKIGVTLVLASIQLLLLTPSNPDVYSQSIAQSTANYTSQNGKIYKNNQEIQLFGVSWFGFEDEGYSVHGLWKRNLTDVIIQMKNQGFNAFRVPFCPANLQNKTTGYIDTVKNPALTGLKSLELFDKVLAEMNAQKMYILLDHHNIDCKQLAPIWYSVNYTEQQWINDLTFVANRYKNLEYFMGIDLKMNLARILLEQLVQKMQPGVLVINCPIGIEQQNEQGKQFYQ
jgi:aryl-phospho-beta-D-glucosidase BglC (GH1 family)